MGLTLALSAAMSGLNVTQSGLELISRNIANAETPGYTRKLLSQESSVRGFESTGVRETDTRREIDIFLQIQVRDAQSELSGVSIREQFLSRVDQLFGTPGQVNALDTLYNEFSNSLQQLITGPEDTIRREDFVGKAQILTQQLRTLTEGVQDLRQLAEDSLSDAVSEVNDLLSQLDAVNNQLTLAGNQPADLLDERDKFVDRLAEYLQITMREDSLGRASIFTRSGNALLEGTPSVLSFDSKGDVNANALYSTDPAERGVGTITVRTSTGYAIDLIQNDAVNSGRIGQLVNLRDNTLVETQNQLDELAHALALTFSNKTVSSTAATSGAATGFQIDTTGMLSGNSLSLTFTETAGPTTRNYTIIRVDDATQLPLANDATPDPDDIVLGVNFSGGMAAVVTALNTALGASNITVSNPSGNILRFLDDGAGGLSNVDSLSGTFTTTATQDDGLQLPLFTDVKSLGLAYSASFDGGPQKTGFAGRIVVNPAVVNDSELLVRHVSSPETSVGSPDRVKELYDRLSAGLFTFSPSTGIGETNRPVRTTIEAFAQRVVTVQTAQADLARRERSSQDVVTSSLTDRYQQAVGVDIDEELSTLITLQNAFSANARVIQTISDMLDTLLRVTA